MKPNEIRIGNYVTFFERGVWEVVRISKSDVWLSQIKDGKETTCMSPPEHNEGIPITEQWLLDFGFDKDYENDFMLEWRGITFYFRLTDNSLRIRYKTKRKVNTIELKHIHQIQNLYFALTGEELKLNKDETKKTD